MRLIVALVGTCLAFQHGAVNGPAHHPKAHAYGNPERHSNGQIIHYGTETSPKRRANTSPKRTAKPHSHGLLLVQRAPGLFVRLNIRHMSPR